MAKGDPRTGGAGYFPAIYQSALSQSAQDYDSIMNQYRSLGDSVKSSSADDKMSYSPLNPDFASYQPGSDYGYLKDFTRTGGYSDSDINNIRERSIAPIRSIYSSANQNLLRQKNLSGGYSPNMGAIQSKLARESSSIIGERTTAANAGIAEMIQRGKLAGATALAPIEARENETRNQIAQLNATIANNFKQINETNRQRTAEQNRQVDTDDFNKILETIRGQQSTYGTTPALASTFGNQVLNAANTVSGFPPVGKTSTSTSIPNPNPWASDRPTLGANMIYNKPKRQLGFGA